MAIKFTDKDTGESPISDLDGEGFYIGEDGKVYENIDQSYANFHYMSLRENINWEIVRDDQS